MNLTHPLSRRSILKLAMLRALAVTLPVTLRSGKLRLP